MEKALDKLLKAEIALGIIAILTLLFRAWALFFIALALFVGTIVWRRILKAKAPKQAETKQVPVKKKTRKNKIYYIGERVTMLVRTKFPNAKWVWAQADTFNRIANGEDVFIILNSAGGYRRDKVSITGNLVRGIEYMQAPSRETVPEHLPDAHPTENVTVDDSGTNYDLMAYEWVETHISELNERLNEAVGEGNVEYILSAKELPVPESWTSVCNELKRAGVSEAECVEEGIKIKII